MPAYNVAPYIGAAIESVLNQTYDDLELLIVDDGATDGSDVIANQYAARDPRVRVIRQPNAGISAARNHALRVASSPVIAILDSDDAWKPAYLQKQMAILTDHPEVDIVTGNAWFLGSSLHGSPARPWPDSRPAPTLADILADETAVFIMSIFRRRVYESIGPFDESLRTNEDYDFWLRAACGGFVFYRNDQPLGYYRRRDNSLSADELRMLPGILQVFRKLRPQLLKRP
jgi:glycosyltransferase involved in cell wall biosynthesis